MNLLGHFSQNLGSSLKPFRGVQNGSCCSTLGSAWPPTLGAAGPAEAGARRGMLRGACSRLQGSPAGGAEPPTHVGAPFFCLWCFFPYFLSLISR